MDLGTIVGLSLAWAMMAAAVVMSGGRFGSFWDVASLLMVLGGTAGSVLASFPLGTVLKTPRVVTKSLFHKPPDCRAIIKRIVGLAEIARREGLLALESKLHQIDDPFIRLGMEMAVDGNRPDATEEVLRTDIQAMTGRHKEGKGVIDQLGRYAPAFGMIGTLLGLVVMLGNLSDPSRIGSGMAVALITTLYGIALANASFLPMAEKLSQLSKQEVLAREIALRGILAIQSGENPRVIEQKLNTFLPPAIRTPWEAPRS
jgi:chemotaxis protein MotA